ncbi:hypothetical protein BDV96DRAFT_342240 [Lophiotrema nucula]|uniref:Uncharacterized protein n=1 Tax=Lophiotrema nucula TaxID=690887 RepID=A0A6A5ZID9_9PLEO|nr:hypothetical protein BDV96DRAFT_342240 [Lophiotrema nucula]
MRACDESRKGRSRLTSPSNLDAQNRNGSRTHGSYTPNKRQRTPNEQTKLGELRQKTSSARQEPTPDSGYDEPISLPTPASSRTTKQVYIDLTQKDAKEVIDLTLDDDDAPLGAHTDAPARLAPQRNNATTEGNPRPKRSLEVVGDSTSESSSKRRRIASKPAGLEHVDERWCKALEEASSWEKDSVAERGVRPYLDIMKRPGAKAVESFDASTNEININKPYIWNGGTCVDVARYSLRDNIFNHMLSDENNTTGKIYDSGNELRALPEADTDKGEIQPVTKLMVAFSAPNPESALSLIDLKNIPNVKVRIPRLLRDLTHNEYPSRCSADINLTAKHCCIDLHIGNLRRNS